MFETMYDGASATVYRDAYGTAHIFAETEAAALYAFGGAQSEDRTATLFAHYLAARGEASSVLGASALERDIAVRAFRIPELSAERYGELPDVVRAGIEAFVAGINEGTSQRPAWAFTVTPQDVVALALLYNLYFADDHFEVGPSQRGSNAFVVAGNRTASGKAIVSLDPHLPFDGPLRWYEGRICGGAMNVYGVTFVGLPYIVMGCNGDVAWANTVNDPDLSDLYEIRLRAEPGKLPEYEYEGKWRSAAVHQYEFPVRGESGFRTVSQTIVSTHHGPILREAGGKRYAVRKSGIGDIHGLTQVREQSLAKSVSEYRVALSGCHIVMFNHLFGDRHGAIGYISAGKVPRRRGGYDYHSAVPGWTAATEWDGYLSIEELPQAIDPESGYLQNCNDAPQYCGATTMDVAPPYPSWLAPDLRTLRGVRLAELLTNAPTGMTIEQAIKIAIDTKDLNAVRELPTLLKAASEVSANDPTLSEYVRILSAWDGELRIDSRGAALFQTWLMQPSVASRLSVGSWVKPDYHRVLPIATVAPGVAIQALRDAAAWLEAYGYALDAAWGELHRLKRGSLDLPMDGGLDSLCPNSGALDEATGKVTAAFGSSFCCLTEPAGEDTRLWACLPWGNSDDPASPHFADQLPIAAQRGYRRVPWTRAQVEAEANRR